MQFKFLSLAAAAVGACLFSSAAPEATLAAAKGPMPVIVIQEIDTPSSESYALWIAEVDKAIKQKIDVDNYIKVFVGEIAGPDSGKTFAVSSAESFAKMTENGRIFEKELGMAKTRVGMTEIRKLGPAVALKAVRWEGRNTSSAVMNTRMTVTDEAAYLQSLDGLRALLDGHDFKDIKLNCMRVTAGRTDYTHLVSLNAPSLERRAAMMDALSSEAWALEWIAAAAKVRTVVSNGTFREITR